MSRGMRQHAAVVRFAKARRQSALNRAEFRQESTPRVSAAGVTSLAIKQVPDDIAKAIAEFERRRGQR